MTVVGDIAVNYTAAQLAALNINGTGGGNTLIVDSGVAPWLRQLFTTAVWAPEMRCN